MNSFRSLEIRDLGSLQIKKCEPSAKAAPIPEFATSRQALKHELGQAKLQCNVMMSEAGVLSMWCYEHREHWLHMQADEVYKLCVQSYNLLARTLATAGVANDEIMKVLDVFKSIEKEFIQVKCAVMRQKSYG